MAKASDGNGFPQNRVFVALAAIAVSLTSIVGAVSLVFPTRKEVRAEYVTKDQYNELRTQMRQHHDELIRRIERMEDDNKEMSAQILLAIRNGGSH